MSHIAVPKYEPVFTVSGWGLWQLPRPEFGSPLWIELKLANRTMPKRWGQRRAYRLCWGVDARRLRRGQEPVLLTEQQPEVYEAVSHFLRTTFTVERLEAKIGRPALEAERARIAAGAAKAAAERALRQTDAWKKMMS